MKKEVEPSSAIRSRLREQGKQIVSFSRGKDCVAAAIALMESGCEVEFYHLYLVPGMRLVEESLAEYERFFGKKILNLPHPSLYRWFQNHIYRPPHECSAIEQSILWNCRWTYEDVNAAARSYFGLPSAYVCTGVRAADSLVRRAAMLTHGPISKDGLCHAVWDWKSDDVEQSILRAGCFLPDDYRLFGRSFDGIDARFLIPLRDGPYRDDYERILNIFPLADINISRFNKWGV
jgi:hypothetical protein